MQQDEQNNDYFDIDQKAKPNSNLNLMKEYQSQYPDKQSALNQLVTEFGLTLEIAIYALLSKQTTSAVNLEEIIGFLFEEDEDTGLMQH